MRAFQCDRCRGFYSEKIHVDAELGNKTYENVNVFHDKVLTYEPLDLCPNCKNSLLEWLKCKESTRNGMWGKWVISEVRCPECLEYFDPEGFSKEEMNKCPNCGAIMREGENNATD